MSRKAYTFDNVFLCLVLPMQFTMRKGLNLSCKWHAREKEHIRSADKENGSACFICNILCAQLMRVLSMYKGGGSFEQCLPFKSC